MTKDNRVLTTTEAANALGISTRRVIALIEAGKLPAVRFGGKSWQIKPADLEKVRNREAGRPRKSPA